MLLKFPVSGYVTPWRWVKSYRRFESRSVSIFRIRQSSVRELLAQGWNVTYQKYRINSTAVITSNLALCTPVTRPNYSTLNMKAVRTFDLKLARLLSDLTEIWYTSKVKGKAIHVQVWTGPVGSRRLRLPNFMTISTHEGSKVGSPTHRPSLHPRKYSWYAAGNFQWHYRESNPRPSAL